MLNRLPHILNVAKLHLGYSEVSPPSERPDVTWPQGTVLLSTCEALADCMKFERIAHPWDELTTWRSAGGALESTVDDALAWSERDTGMITVLKLACEQNQNTTNEVHEIFPYCRYGIQQTVLLNQVRVWESGLAAHIDGSVGETSISFFDTDFVCNRDWYQRDLKCEFILTGIAYSASLAESHSFEIPRTEEWFESMQWLSGGNEYPEANSGVEHFSTEGMSVLLPAEDGDVDEYVFRGSVTETWGMSMLGQRAWRVRVTVIRNSDDFELDIVVTKRVWEGDEPPQVGQEIEGRMWLQGRLWSAD